MRASLLVSVLLLGCRPPILADTAPDPCEAVLYIDADGDGYGEIETGCEDPDGVTAGGDCDDANAAVHPDAEEVCNKLDDNCDDTADEGLTGTTFYEDVDGDGHGDPAQGEQFCADPGTGFSTLDDDCLDTDPAVFPGAPELCDGFDNDCDDVTDGHVATWFDADGTATDQSAQPAGALALPGDGALALCSGTWPWRLTIPADATVSVTGAVEDVVLDAQAGGVGIAIGSRAVVTVEALTVTSGRTSGNGAGITAGTGAMVTLTGVQVSGSVADGFGGGLYVSHGATVTMAGGVVSGNTSGGDGAAIYVDSTGTFDATDATFEGNTTAGNGALAVNGGSTTITGSTFRANEAGDGGGVAVFGGTASVSGSYFEENVSTGSGGAIELSGNAAVVIDTTEFTGNIGPFGGGAIYASASTVTVTSCVFAANSTSLGAGGAIGLSTGDLTVSGSSFQANQAGWSGGAISADGADIGISGDVTFDQNAAVLGGGLYAGAACVVTDGASAWTANSATTGAGVYVVDSSLTSTGSTFDANVASGAGGALYLTQSARNTASLTLDGATISNNTADSGAGVAVSGPAALAFSTGTMVVDNVAASDGGGLLLGQFGDSYAGTATCTDSSFQASSPEDVWLGLMPSLGTFTGVNCTVDNMQLVPGVAAGVNNNFVCQSTGCE